MVPASLCRCPEVAEPDDQLISFPCTDNLSLAGAGRAAVGLDASGPSGVAVCDRGLSNIVRVGERCLAHTADSLPGSRGPAILLVGRKIERDEEQQVRAENADSSDGGKLLSGALAGIGEPLPVSRGEVGPRREVDKACQMLALGPTSRPAGRENIPRSMMNCRIWRRVIHSFHQMRMPRALWK
jgi:hypothetical protein